MKMTSAQTAADQLFASRAPSMVSARLNPNHMLGLVLDGFT